MFSILRQHFLIILFFFNATATTEIYTLSLHDALPICTAHLCAHRGLHVVSRGPFSPDAERGPLGRDRRNDEPALQPERGAAVPRSQLDFCGRDARRREPHDDVRPPVIDDGVSDQHAAVARRPVGAAGTRIFAIPLPASTDQEASVRSLLPRRVVRAAADELRRPRRSPFPVVVQARLLNALQHLPVTAAARSYTPGAATAPAVALISR